VILLPVGKRLAARLAGGRPGLDVPLVHERGNLSTNGADKHADFSKQMRLRGQVNKKKTNEV
jgi:hypothetical protein